MILYLKFIVDTGRTLRLVRSPALINSLGYYEDAIYIHTEDGKFEKNKVQGSIEHEYIEELK